MSPSYTYMLLGWQRADHLDDDDMQWRSFIITYNIQEYTHVTNLPI